MTVFFTADQHFNHSNIIKYCNRPFKDSEDQTEQLITNWNSVVGLNDEVWVLGDFFFFYKPRKNNEKEMIIYDKNTEECKEILSRLNGRINLIIGNHDIRSGEQYKEMGFDFVSPYPIVYNEFFILSHYPLQLSETTPYFNLYGHVHNDNKYTDNATSKCVCVERTEYKPISLDDIISSLKH